MLISTKGRYALRVMADLAEQGAGAYVPLKDIAGRQEISQKYLESIMAALSREGFVDAVQGKGGGYRLKREAGDYTLAAILRATEGPLAPVACLEAPENSCPRAGGCPTLPIWRELDRRIGEYLESVSLADLIQNTSSGDYVI